MSASVIPAPNSPFPSESSAAFQSCPRTTLPSGFLGRSHPKRTRKRRRTRGYAWPTPAPCRSGHPSTAKLHGSGRQGQEVALGLGAASIGARFRARKLWSGELGREDRSHDLPPGLDSSPRHACLIPLGWQFANVPAVLFFQGHPKCGELCVVLLKRGSLGCAPM